MKYHGCNRINYSRPLSTSHPFYHNSVKIRTYLFITTIHSIFILIYVWITEILCWWWRKHCADDEARCAICRLLIKFLYCCFSIWNSLFLSDFNHFLWIIIFFVFFRPAENSWMRLSAANCMLKLCQEPNYAQVILLDQFQVLAYMMNVRYFCNLFSILTLLLSSFISVNLLLKYFRSRRRRFKFLQIVIILSKLL